MPNQTKQRTGCVVVPKVLPFLLQIASIFAVAAPNGRIGIWQSQYRNFLVEEAFA
jgi:hypothetical protein